MIFENPTGTITIIALFLAGFFGLALKKRIQEDFTSLQTDLRELTKAFESIKFSLAKVEHSIDLVGLSNKNFESRFSEIPSMRDDLRAIEKRITKVEHGRLHA